MTLVVFDCDGTLVDSQHMIFAAMTRAFEAESLEPLPRQRVLSIVGLSLPLAVERLIPTAPAGKVEDVSNAYKAAFAELRRRADAHEPMFDGALDAIDVLHRSHCVRLGIATGKSRRGLDAVLQRFEITDRFVTLQTADDNPSKPHPHMLQRAMAEAGAEPHETVMIGDTTFDIEMALSAGASAIGVSWGYHPVGDLQAAGAHEIIDAYPALTGAVERVLAARRTQP